MFLQILLFIFAAIFVLYWFALRQQKFWQNRGIPGPDGVLLKGNLDNVFGEKPAVLQLQKWTQQFGKIYGIQEGCFQKVLVISDPEMIRQLLIDKFEYFHGRINNPLIGDVDKTELIHLVAAQGKRWKRLRSIANPAFSLANLKRVMPILDDSIRVTMNFLEEARLQGKPINMHTFFTEMTFDVISRVAMGQKGTLQFRSPYLKLAQKCFNRFNNYFWDYYAMLFPWVGRNILRPFLRVVGPLLGDPVSEMLQQCRNAVVERKRQKVEGNFGKNEENGRKFVDFIDLFLEVESDVQLTNENRAYNKAEKFERKNTTEEIVMHCFVFLLAGFDTTANSLSIISHNLVMHPEVQQKLWEEIDTICGGVGEVEALSYDQLGQLKYADAVIKETLRLCPIASSVVNRIAAETVTLGNIKLEKGMGVKPDLLTLHRDKTIWGPDAEEFKPERWLDPSFVQPSAYYPFGGGPRICIGMRMALMEEKMLVHLLRRFRLNKCPETEIELNLTGQVVLNPNSVTMKLEQRLVD